MMTQDEAYLSVIAWPRGRVGLREMPLPSRTGKPYP